MTGCLFTVYAPDPQDCSAPAVAVRDGLPVCAEHRAFVDWAASREEDG